jgi:hypothetical protein
MIEKLDHNAIGVAALTTRVYLDTEFTKFVRPQLISLGLVAESGQEFYGESTDFVRVQCSDFVLENVLPLLQGGDAAASLDVLRVKLVRSLAALPSPAEIISDFDGDIELLLKLLQISAKEIERCNIAALTVLDGELVQSENFNRALDDYFASVDLPRHHALVDARALKYAESQCNLRRNRREFQF